MNMPLPFTVGFCIFISLVIALLCLVTGMFVAHNDRPKAGAAFAVGIFATVAIVGFRRSVVADAAYDLLWVDAMNIVFYLTGVLVSLCGFLCIQPSQRYWKTTEAYDDLKKEIERSETLVDIEPSRLANIDQDMGAEAHMQASMHRERLQVDADALRQQLVAERCRHQDILDSIWTVCSYGQGEILNAYERGKFLANGTL